MPSRKIASGPDSLVMPDGVIFGVRGIPLLAPPGCDLRPKGGGLSGAKACDGSGNDLHGQPSYPSQHCNHCPEDVWIFTKHNHADRYKGRQCSEKCADGAEKFRGINLSTEAAVRRPGIWSVQSQRRSINSQIESDGDADHHDEQESLRSKRLDAGSHMDGNKQPARSSGHRKPNAFQDVGSLSYDESHGRYPPGAKGLS